MENGILNIEAGDRHALDTNHNPLLCTLQFRFSAFRQPSNQSAVPPYLLPPSKEQVDNAFYKFTQLAPNHSALKYDDWITKWIWATQECFPVRKKTHFKNWITPETKALIQQRTLAAQINDTENWRILDRAVKAAARSDKRSWFLNLTGPDVSESDRWRVLKPTRSHSKPKLTFELTDLVILFY